VGTRLAILLAIAMFAAPAAADHGVKRDFGGKERCRNANDPAKCQARAAAQEACKDKAEGDRQACAAERVCAGESDPARCRAHEMKRGK